MTTPVAAITVDATDARDAEAIARAMYGWPGGRITVRYLTGSTYHVILNEYRGAERAGLVRQYNASRARSERAAMLGDHAGALIAAGDARRILKQLTAERLAAAS